MKPGEIRPIVICVFRDNDRVFVAEYDDPATGTQFYRPLGGALRFGEYSRECIIREIREELSAEIQDLAYLGTIENIFTYAGQPGHEIVLVYQANFVDLRLYETQPLRCQEDDSSEFVATWKPMDDFRTGTAPLYPTGLLDLLDRNLGTRIHTDVTDGHGSEKEIRDNPSNPCTKEKHMSTDPDFLHVKGAEIVNGRGETVHLRGFCLGGWMNMENFITGYPGHESGLRAAVANVLGEAKARFFFERFLHYFIAEDDLRFLKSLGCTVVRVPFNYRHFESDDRPFEYKPEGFALLDRVIGWARAQGLYVILDLHAVQGWQNGGWHSDNPTTTALFWGQKVFEERAVALWEELARRYRNEAFVAGYNVMNEPNTADAKWLNRFYRRVTAAIRAIDPHHILFLEGNRDSQQFHELEPPFDGNTVYSSHNYVVPGLESGKYPGTFDGEVYDHARLEQGYLERTAFMREHHVPHWFGEFGCLFTDPALEASRLRTLADLIDIAEQYGDHWTIWTYKDIGKMGLVYADPESEWMRRTRSVRQAKTTLRCDSWIERHESTIEGLIGQIGDYVRTVVGGNTTGGAVGDRPQQGGLPGDWANLNDTLRWAICDGALSRALLPAFAEQFRGMNEAEIDEMVQSFALSNCIQREGMAQVVRVRALEG